MHIAVRGLSKWYGASWALRGISLDFEPGQIVALLGPNGAGKTTLLRCLAGLATPNRGTIRFDGETFDRSRIDLRKRFLFLSDSPNFLSTHDVVSRIAISLELYGKDVDGYDECVVELLREFDLISKEDVLLRRLSRGQAYKASLVALLAIDPEVWLLDEPFASGMDPHGISRFKRHACDAIARGRTVIYTTQILEIAESFSDRVCLLNEGSVYAFDRFSTLREQVVTQGNVLEALFDRLHENSR